MKVVFLSAVRNCEWGDWTNWSLCSTTCGGWQSSHRRFVQIASQGGKKCSGDASRERACRSVCGENHLFNTRFIDFVIKLVVDFVFTLSQEEHPQQTNQNKIQYTFPHPNINPSLPLT